MTEGLQLIYKKNDDLKQKEKLKFYWKELIMLCLDFVSQYMISRTRRNARA